MRLGYGKYVVTNIGKGLDVFKDCIAHDCRGLFITRQHPSAYADLDCTLVWLSQKNGKNVMDPTNLPLLSHTVIEFIKNTNNPIVLLEGFEYLMVQNEFQKLLKHLYMIDDYVNIHGAIFLLVINPESLKRKELSVLSSEYEDLEGKRKV